MPMQSTSTVVPGPCWLKQKCIPVQNSIQWKLHEHTNKHVAYTLYAQGTLRVCSGYAHGYAQGTLRTILQKQELLCVETNHCDQKYARPFLELQLEPSRPGNICLMSR